MSEIVEANFIIERNGGVVGSFHIANGNHFQVRFRDEDHAATWVKELTPRVVNWGRLQ